MPLSRGVRASLGFCLFLSRAPATSPRGRFSRPSWAPTLAGPMPGLAIFDVSATRPPPSEVRKLCAPASRRVCPFRSRSGIVIDRRHHTHVERSLRRWLSDMVASVVQTRGHVICLIAAGIIGLPAALRGILVGPHMGVVRVLPAHDGGTRRAAKRV